MDPEPEFTHYTFNFRQMSRVPRVFFSGSTWRATIGARVLTEVDRWDVDLRRSSAHAQTSALAKEVRLSPTVNQANLVVVPGHLFQDQVLDPQ